jgi:ParB family transcriptional regulator, chromosome partitioning protein
VNTPVLSIPLDLIEVGERLRAVDADYVALIAESLADRGLDTPIIVTGAGADGRHRLIAGGHRVAAARQAGWTEIAAKVVEADELQAKLIEIDENLVRRELSALDRAVFLAERKRIYEALNPSAKRGGDRRGTKRASLHVWSFSKATAERLGLDESTIRRAVKRAAILPEVRARLARHRAAESGAELDKIAALPPQTQKDVAEVLANNEAVQSVAAALRLLAAGGVIMPRAQEQAEMRQYLALMALWRKADRKQRRAFLLWLDGEGELDAFKEAA